MRRPSERDSNYGAGKRVVAVANRRGNRQNTSFDRWAVERTRDRKPEVGWPPRTVCRKNSDRPSDLEESEGSDGS